MLSNVVNVVFCWRGVPCIRGLSINVNSWSIHDQYRLDAQAQARCNRRLQLHPVSTFTLSPPTSPGLHPDFHLTLHLTAVWLALAGQGSKLHPIIIIGYNIGYNMFLPSSLLLLLRLFRDWELRLIRLDSSTVNRTSDGADPSIHSGWSRVDVFEVVCIRGGRWQKGQKGQKGHMMARNQPHGQSVGQSKKTVWANNRFFEQMILDDRWWEELSAILRYCGWLCMIASLASLASHQHCEAWACADHVAIVFLGGYMGGYNW